MVPDGHGVQLRAPLREKNPGGHCVHLSVYPPEYVPALQGVHLFVMSEENLPAAHTKQPYLSVQPAPGGQSEKLLIVNQRFSMSTLMTLIAIARDLLMDQQNRN